MNHQDLLRFFHKNYPTIVGDMRKADHALHNSSLNTYHLEGTIWEHTMLVLHEAVKRGYGFETELAALLHDIGKPDVRTENYDKQKVTFYNHEALSVFQSLKIMEDLNLPHDVRERLVKVIGLHTEVFKQPLQSLYELIQDDQTFDLLMKLATCDHSGRFHDLDQSPIDYTLYLPKEIEEKEDNTKDRTVTIMVGLPASGKTTTIACKKYFDNAFIVSRDNIIESLEGSNYNEKWKNADQKEVDKKLQQLFQESKKHKNIVVDMTHMSMKSRRKTLSHYGKDWNKNCIVILPTISKLYSNIQKRTEKQIDYSVLDAMMLSFRPPVIGEGFDNINYIF